MGDKHGASDPFSLILGAKYWRGRGVLQDYVLADMWFNIASVSGDERAANNRNLAAVQMTREQIADAAKRAKVRMSSDYQDCD